MQTVTEAAWPSDATRYRCRCGCLPSGRRTLETVITDLGKRQLFVRDIASMGEPVPLVLSSGEREPVAASCRTGDGRDVIVVLSRPDGVSRLTHVC